MIYNLFPAFMANLVLSKLRSPCPEEHFEQLFESSAVNAARIGKSPEKKVYILRECFSSRIIIHYDRKY